MMMNGFENGKRTAWLLCAALCLSLAACSSGGSGGAGAGKDAVSVTYVNADNGAGETEGLVFFGEKRAAEPIGDFILGLRNNLGGTAAAAVTYSPDMEEPVSYVQEVEEFYSLYRVEEDGTDLISNAVSTYQISSGNGTVAYVDTDNRLYLYDEAAESSVLIDTISTAYFAVSPNGESIAYTVEAGGGYQTNVYRDGTATVLREGMSGNCIPVAVPDHGGYVYAVQGNDIGTGTFVCLSAEGIAFTAPGTACHFLLNRTHEEILFFQTNVNRLMTDDTSLCLAKGEEKIPLFDFGLEHIDGMTLLGTGECDNWSEVRDNYENTYFVKTCSTDHFDGETLVFNESVDSGAEPYYMHMRRQTVCLDEKGALSEKEVTNWRLNNYQLSHYRFAGGTIVGEVQKIADEVVDYTNAGEGALYYVTADAELYYWTEADGAVPVDTDVQSSMCVFGDTLLYSKYVPDSEGSVDMALFRSEKGSAGEPVMGGLSRMHMGKVFTCGQETEEGISHYCSTDGKDFKLLHQTQP